MKVIVEEKDRDRDIEFPCLMKDKDSDLIVLFYEDQKGVAVSGGGEDYPIGRHSYSWVTGSFEPFDGRVILEN